ncbi:MAG TPA: hypothetical protein VIE12_01765 [Actinomycetota bacterium]|jgi:hypothetical protein
MARMFVEGWAPEYGAPFDPDEQLAPAEGEVDPTVERRDWEPLEGADDGCERIAFVDGVRRVDARLLMDDPASGPIPGICGTFAVGATVWHRSDRRSEIRDVKVERWAVLAGGHADELPAVALEPPYRSTTTPSDDPSHLVAVLHTRMRRAEGELASALAADAFVVADGPLNKPLAPLPVVGYVKTHRVTYLPAEQNAVIAELAPAQRTPLFTIAADRPDVCRYSWYVRLAMLRGGHSWTGIVRCEASGRWSKDDVRTIADRTAALLPIVGSEPQIDPRAPQNLVPIGALERELRHRMGDPGLVYRALRHAVSEREAS